MPRVHVNIGSNLGDRMAIISRAVDLLHPLGSTFRVSSPVDSDPWGYVSENRFLNVGVSFDTSMDPLTTLRSVLTIQQTLSDAPHRGVCGGYCDRLIDLDLIFYDDIIVGWYPVSPQSNIPSANALAAGTSAPEKSAAVPNLLDTSELCGWKYDSDAELILPHPRMCARLFTLIPISEIDHHWRHPICQLTAAQMIDLQRNIGDVL